MIELLDETEGFPAYPDPPAGVSDDAPEEDAIWPRLEGFTAYRWGARQVQWIVQDAGVFVPRLQPATFTKAERWTGDDWQTIDPDKAPLGLLLGDGTYRLTYSVGTDDDPAPIVLEAYRRLAAYWAEARAADAGLSSVTDGDYSATRSVNATGRALFYSGAADLLRAYR